MILTNPKPTIFFTSLIAGLFLLETVYPQHTHFRYVDPFIGTSGDHGQTDPAATIPFGTIKPGPDTKPTGHAGYNYEADELLGFSQTRISGVGCSGAGGNLRLLPFIGIPRDTETIDKTSEIAQAGFYSVTLRNGVKTEITTGRMTAIYRFTYPEGENMGLRLDFRSSFAKFKGEEHHVLNDNMVEGFVSASNTCDFGAYKFYYHVEIDGGHAAVTDRDSCLVWNFPGRSGQTVLVRVGLSSVSTTNARLNLESETRGKSLEQLRDEAENCWEEVLSRIQVETPDEDLKKSFYTRMYHASLTPFNITDCTSEYSGSDGRIYRSGRDQYHGWSIWDTFRTKAPLFTLLYPDEYTDMIMSLMKLYLQGKPDWATQSEPFPTVRTEHSIVLMLDALTKGLADTSAIELIFPRILEETEHISGKSPDKILERCYDYWAVSELARHLGMTETADRFQTMSKEYRPLWIEKFKTITDRFDIMHGDGLYEGTLWQYRWFVPHDLDWMVAAIGSRGKTRSELDRFFDGNLFNIGNQPDIHVPYLYYYLGQPWKTQKLVRDLMLESTVNNYGTHVKWKQPVIGKVFKTTPDGYLREMDDDAGTMSSWYVLSSIGLFPVCPGVPYFWVSAPIFDSIAIKNRNGTTFNIKVVKKSAKDIYIRSASLNGKEMKACFVSYQDIISGGELVLELGENPNKAWGRTIPVY